MKISKLKKDVDFGREFAREIKKSATREDMKIIRCILCNDFHNIPGIIKFTGMVPERFNQAVSVGIFIEMIK